jgi:dCMP deaminase
MKKGEKIKKYKRPSWDEYFMSIAELAGTRATCDRGRSGCVVVCNKRILSTGYVGSPIGIDHCDDIGHEMHTVVNDEDVKTRHCIRTTHAEQNAIAQAARIGISLEGGTIYVHMTPCYTCAKMIINAGIKRVVAMLDYHAGNRSKEVFKKAGVKYELLNKKIQKYQDM